MSCGCRSDHRRGGVAILQNYYRRALRWLDGDRKIGAPSRLQNGSTLERETLMTQVTWAERDSSQTPDLPKPDPDDEDEAPETPPTEPPPIPVQDPPEAPTPPPPYVVA